MQSREIDFFCCLFVCAGNFVLCLFECIMLTAVIKYDENSFRPEMKEAAMKARSLIATSSLFTVNISITREINCCQHSILVLMQPCLTGRDDKL